MEQYKVLLRLLTQIRQAHDYTQMAVTNIAIGNAIMATLKESEDRLQYELHQEYKRLTVEQLAEADEYVQSGEYQKQRVRVL
tara:strand:+ start:91 stop:336 length:246 start_codon:yes stop_codon:yes gene_type:complete